MITGEHPPKTDSNRRYMVALVKVNGLEAYALLDSSSTTMSITNNFARVAKLSVLQLENPVTLQLGTIGSWSMINYGTKAQIELGPIKEDDAYLNIVNIDQYDMIIGTPFMRKHKFVVDFGHNTFSVCGQAICPMTSGQEDLMIIWKQRSQTRPGMPLTYERSMACKSD